MTVTERIKRSAEAREKARQEKNRYKARAVRAETQLAEALSLLREYAHADSSRLALVRRLEQWLNSIYSQPEKL